MAVNGDNGDAGTNPTGRVRIDRPRHGGHVPSPPGPEEGPGGFFTSGRVFVTAVVLVVLLVWGSLNLVFRQWRAGYRARAAYGDRVVVTPIEPLASVAPTGEDPDAWRSAVGETRAMLKTLTGSNVLDEPHMRVLGELIAAEVRLARPDDARARLTAIWDAAEAGAGPVVTSRHPRPLLLCPSGAQPASERAP